MTTPTDPLQPLLDFVADLAGFQQVVTKIQPLAVDLQSGLSDFETVLGAPASAAKDLGDFDDLLQLLQDLVEALSDIEFLEFLGPVADVIKTLRDGIHDAVKLLDDLDTGLGDIKRAADSFNTPVGDVATVTTDLEQHLGTWVNQMNLIDDSMQLAQGVALLVQGSFGQELDKITGVYVDIANDLTQTLNPVLSALNDVETAIATVSSELGKIKQPIQPVIDIATTVTKAFDKIAFLKPILDAIKTALAPVLWVLKAVSCVIKKVLDPIIKPILKATGIESKIKVLFDNLLGISGIKTAVASATSAVGGLTSGFTSAAKTLVTHSTALAGLKGQVETTFDKYLDTTFNQQIEMLGTALGHAPKNGDIDVGAYTTEYDKFWGVIANLLSLLQANTTSKDVTVAIDTLLGAGNALVSGNATVRRPVTIDRPLRRTATAGPTPDEVAFWSKVKAYLTTLKASSTDQDVLTTVDTILSAGNAFFAAQQSIHSVPSATVALSANYATT